MSFDTRADQEIADIKASNGRVEPSVLLQRISSLEQECRNAQLPSRTKERYQTILSDLRSQFRVSRTARFRFRSSVRDPGEDEEEVAQEDNAIRGSHPASDPTSNPTNAPSSPHPKLVNQTITTGNNLQNLDQCTIVLDTPHSVHISNAQECTIVAQCHQLRLTNCHECQVYAGCPRPAIEQCTDLVIGTVSGAQKWDQVDDFGWIRSGPSPHWKRGDEISQPQIEKLRLGSS